MKMEDLINGEHTIPEKLDRFFKALIGGKDIRHRDGVNCHRLSNSLASDAIYCVSNGTVKSSKHITLGVFINECGLSHMRIESNIIASGSVKGLVEGKHFNRCKRLHPLMALVLKMLHFDHFLKMDNIEYNFLKEQVIDDLLHYQEVIDSYTSMPIELPNNELSRVLSAYQKFVDETRQDNLNKVDETHPGLKSDFMNGCFGIKRTYKPFSSIPIDLTLERLNSEATRCLSGIAHLTISLAARQRWTKSYSIRATIISHVLYFCGLKQLQDVSADLQPNRIKIYGKQL
ncbi:uncharacterized protein TNCV_2771221 [Trichonephila clavipes]|nr:uncharacterized protein TNCV_2771221 [Trichonephila clavipes]